MTNFFNSFFLFVLTKIVLDRAHFSLLSQLESKEFLDESDLEFVRKVLSSCAWTGDGEGAKVVHEALEKNEIPVEVDLWNKLIFAYAKSSDSQSAEKAFNEVVNHPTLSPSAYTFDAMMEAYSRNRDIHGAERIFKMMKEADTPKRPRTYSGMVSVLGKTGRIGKAEKILKEMLDENMKVSFEAYSGLMKGCAIRGDYVKAQKYFDEIVENEYILNSNVYGSLVCAYGKGQKPVEAERIFREMIENGFEPNLSVYNMLIDAYASRGQNPKARELLEEMKEKGLEPNAAVYCSIMKGLIMKKKMREVQNVVGEMKKNNIKPDNSVYNLLVNSLENLSLEVFDDVLDEMQNREITPDLKFFNSAMANFSGNYSRTGIDGIFKRLQQFGLKPNEETYNIAMTGESKKGDVRAAEQLIEKMKKTNIQPDIRNYNNLLTIYGKKPTKELVTRSEKLYQELVETGKADKLTHQAMCLFYGKAGMISKAEKLIDDLVKKEGPKEIFFEALIHAYLENDDLGAAEECFEKNFGSKLNMKVGSYLRLIREYGRRGNLSKALEILERMEKEGFGIDFSLYRALIEGLLNGGHGVEAHTVSEMTKKKIDLDQGMYDSLMFHFTNAKDPKYVRQMYDEYPFKNPKKALHFLVKAYASGGFPDEAREWLKEMKESSLFPHYGTYQAILLAYARLGEIEKMQETLEEVEQNFRKGQWVQAYYDVMAVFAEGGNLTILRKLQKELKKKNAYHSNERQSLMFYGVSKSGRYKTAVEVMKKLGKSTSNQLHFLPLLDMSIVRGDLETLEYIFDNFEKNISSGSPRVANSLLSVLNDAQKADKLYERMTGIPNEETFAQLIRIRKQNNLEIDSLQKEMDAFGVLIPSQEQKDD